MKRPGLGLLMAAGALLGLANATAQVTYVGSDVCRQCHWKQWSAFRTSGHPFALRSDASARPLPVPGGYDWDEIGWVVGGHTHKAIYLDPDGYLITGIYPGGSREEDGKNQYNLLTNKWVDAHAGELKRFDCGGCHTTGFGAGGLNPKPGFQGTWGLDGVQCEACHGAASQHVGPPFNLLNVRRESSLCGGCHRNGDLRKVPAADGFLSPNAQYNELLASPHDGRYCVECHDPHKRAEQSIITNCTDCHTHSNKAKRSDFKPLGQRHLDRGIRCWDCHMPYAVKSADSENRWMGDERSHLFRISLDEQVKMFNDNGSLSTGTLTAGFACLGCHAEQARKWEARGQPNKAEVWAKRNAARIHK